MAALKLLKVARAAGLKLRAEGDRLVIRGPKSAEPIAKALLDRKADILPFLRKRPAPFHDDAREKVQRAFLPRPLGQEDALDPWEVWTPLFDWLIEHHPSHFHAVCSAEDKLNEMERDGMTSGAAYEAACHDLLVKFETARRLKLTGYKTWMH